MTNTIIVIYRGDRFRSFVTIIHKHDVWLQKNHTNMMCIIFLL